MGVPKGGIAFFDSGIGGLTVLSACENALKGELFYYYGDNQRAPYGNLSQKKIRKYVLRAFRRFEKLNVKAAVVACNTATAVCIEELRKRYAFPVLGIQPALRLAAKGGGEVVALSTRATYESERYRLLRQRVKESYPAVCITPYPCDDLAGEIEKNLGKTGADFTPFLPRHTTKPTTVVLGCTHYTYIKKEIEGFYGCKAVDGNEGVARRLKELLKGKNQSQNSPAKKGKKINEKRPRNTQNHFRPPRPRFCPRTGEEEGTFFKDDEKKLLRQNINKRSPFLKKSSPQPLETKGGGQIFFLGRSKKRNRITYEQTFV